MFRALAAVVAIRLSYAELTNQGSVRCPCLNRTFQATDAMSSCFHLKPSVSAGVECYPLSYGQYCNAWDSGLPPSCTSGNDQVFCDASWCYVNASICSASNVSMTRSSSFLDMFWSYETCGSRDTWSSFTIRESLKGNVLRAGLPGLWYPWAFRRNSQGEKIKTNWTHGHDGVGDTLGIHPELFTLLAERAGFEITWVPLSEGSLADSKEAGTGTWDACVRDVAAGHIDICPMYMYETSSRRAITQFTIPFGDDTAYMAVQRPKIETSLQDELVKVFEPFDAGLWLLLAIAAIAVGIMYQLLSSRREMEVMTFSHVSGWKRVSEFMKFIVHAMTNAVYVSTLELFAGAPLNADESDSFERKLIQVPWAFFTMFALATYTANMAAFLSAQKIEMPFKNVQQCISKGCRFCTDGYALTDQRLITYYDNLNLVKLDLQKIQVWKGLAAGQLPSCDATFQFSTEVRMDEVYARGICNNVFVGTQLFSVPIAWPVSNRIAPTINYHLLNLIDEGVWKDLYAKYRPSSTCNFFDAEPVQQDEDMPQLKAVQFAGPAGFLGVCMLLAVILHCCKKAQPVKRKSSFAEKTLSGDNGSAEIKEDTEGEAEFEEISVEVEDIASGCEVGSTNSQITVMHEDLKRELENVKLELRLIAKQTHSQNI